MLIISLLIALSTKTIKKSNLENMDDRLIEVKYNKIRQ